MNYLALFDVLRIGSSVANPAVWKQRTALTVALSGLFIAINHVYPLGFDQQTADAVAGTIAFVVSLFGTYATSDKVGMFPAKSAPTDNGPTDVSGGA